MTRENRSHVLGADADKMVGEDAGTACKTILKGQDDLDGFGVLLRTPEMFHHGLDPAGPFVAIQIIDVWISISP